MKKILILVLGLGLLASVHSSQAMGNNFSLAQPPVLDDTITLSNKKPVPSPEIPDDTPVSDIMRVCMERPQCLYNTPPCKVEYPIDSEWCPPKPTSTPAPTCVPRPWCMDHEPRCLFPILDDSNWCLPNPSIEPSPTTGPLPSIIASPLPTFEPLPLPSVSPPTPFWWPFKKAEVTLQAQIHLCFDNRTAYEDKFWICADARFPFNLLGKWGNCRPIITKKTGDSQVATGSIKLWSGRDYTLYPPTKAPVYYDFLFNPKSFTLNPTGQTATVTVSNSLLGCPVSYPVPTN